MAGESVAVTEAFPFGVRFQGALLRLLAEDHGFALAVMPHLEPAYFEHEAMAWAYAAMERYVESYQAIPKIEIIRDEANRLNPPQKDVYVLTLDQVAQADLTGADWLRDQVLDFVKRNIYVQAHRESADAYNRGEVERAYEVSMRAAEKILHTDWAPVDRSFFFDDFPQRYSDRLSADPYRESVPTGILDLDQILGGGLSRGELGIWVAYPKRGKTTILANHGVQAVRRSEHNVFHAVLEGSRQMVEDRYDTIFAQESYQKVKSSGMSSEAYEAMRYDYQMFKRRLLIRGYTERWDYTVASLEEELLDQRRMSGWEPSLVIVDYGDLLRGRGQHRTEVEHQRAAFRDLKTLANRGFAVWTASQAQRPKDNADPDTSSALLKSKNIADAYDKVRVADFIGTLNQTLEERQHHQLRLFAELYRGNAADRVILVKADFSTMTISGVTDPKEAVLPLASAPSTPMGYAVPQQRKAPV